MIIHGVSIHTGGGKVLLDQLLTDETLGKISHLICDQRYLLPSKISNKVVIHRIQPTLKSRIKAEFLLKEIASKSPDEKILCFSNLPPIFKLPNPVILFLQNALILKGVPQYAENLKVKLRILYEKIWFNFFLKNACEVWVQTEWMKDKFLEYYNLKILVKPIVLNLPPPIPASIKRYDFISVSGSAPHKHLLDLVLAWKLLPEPRPKLLIIGDKPNNEIKAALDQITDGSVMFVTDVMRKELFNYYQESRALILTSKLESYCLPLYEAKHFQLKVLAPNERYVLEADRKSVV